LKEAPLGWTRIKSGLILRQAMLINGIMYNSEAWHGITPSDVISFEKVDEALLRGIVGGHAKLPLAALYLECGQVPLRFIWASRRIMFLHTILKRDDTELTKKIYSLQKADPLKGDFVDLVEADMKMIELNKNDDEIKYMSKQAIKELVKAKVANSALKYLLSIKSEKMKNLKYVKLQTQSYMSSPMFSQKQASLLMAIRTRTVRGIRSDFGGMFPSKKCPLQDCSDEDTLPNILKCRVLKAKCDIKMLESLDRVKYIDVFSDCIDKQKEAITTYGQMLETRQRLLESSPAASRLVPLH
jgi:hypothetical protein